MRIISNPLALVAKLTACATLVVGITVQADDKKPDVAGTWTWTMPARGGGADRTNTLKLKIEGEKLTGKLAAPGRGGEMMETEIADGKVAAGEVSFTINRETQNGKITFKYTGKLDGDSIKGKIDVDRGDGNTQTRDWEAKRVAEKAATPDKTEKSDKM